MADLNIYRVNDWAFVAANSMDEAKEWHRKECPGEEVDDDWCEQVPDTMPMRTGEEPNSPTVTFREALTTRLSEGEAAPFLLCVDGHYA